MQVKDVMIPVIGSVSPDTNLRDVTEKMRSLDLDPMPVVENHKVVGVLTEGDILDRVRTAGLGSGSVLARDVMRKNTICCFADQDVSAALDTLEKGGTSRVPVIDRAQNLVGIVSAEDLRKREQILAGEVSAAGAVESVSDLATFDDDRVDFMSDSSFPASDPIPPPTSLGRESSGDKDPS